MSLRPYRGTRCVTQKSCDRYGRVQDGCRSNSVLRADRPYGF